MVLREVTSTHLGTVVKNMTSGCFGTHYPLESAVLLCARLELDPSIYDTYMRLGHHPPWSQKLNISCPAGFCPIKMQWSFSGVRMAPVPYRDEVCCMTLETGDSQDLNTQPSGAMRGFSHNSQASMIPSIKFGTDTRGQPTQAGACVRAI